MTQNSLHKTPIGLCATYACLLEATAFKPGNVHRGADFEDLTYLDFAISSATIGPSIEKVQSVGVGQTVLDMVLATKHAVGTNTNLGMLLLLAPLAAVPEQTPLQTGIGEILSQLSAEDTKHIYEAIRQANAGGLGEADQADINANAPDLPVKEVMALAADRDSIAAQFGNDFANVFSIAEVIATGVQQGWPLSDAIAFAQIKQISTVPDTLIARKCGLEIAQEASDRAAAVLESGLPGEEDYEFQIADLDFWMRSDGHRKNPGTTADLIAASLFVLLREGRLSMPIRFYR